MKSFWHKNKFSFIRFKEKKLTFTWKILLAWFWRAAYCNCLLVESSVIIFLTHHLSTKLYFCSFKRWGQKEVAYLQNIWKNLAEKFIRTKIVRGWSSYEMINVYLSDDSSYFVFGKNCFLFVAICRLYGKQQLNLGWLKRQQFEGRVM